MEKVNRDIIGPAYLRIGYAFLAAKPQSLSLPAWHTARSTRRLFIEKGSSARTRSTHSTVPTPCCGSCAIDRVPLAAALPRLSINRARNP
jgi:hypothetical protein